MLCERLKRASEKNDLPPKCLHFLLKRCLYTRPQKLRYYENHARKNGHFFPRLPPKLISAGGASAEGASRKFWEITGLFHLKLPLPSSRVLGNNFPGNCIVYCSLRLVAPGLTTPPPHTHLCCTCCAFVHLNCCTWLDPTHTHPTPRTHTNTHLFAQRILRAS